MSSDVHDDAPNDDLPYVLPPIIPATPELPPTEAVPTIPIGRNVQPIPPQLAEPTAGQRVTIDTSPDAPVPAPAPPARPTTSWADHMPAASAAPQTELRKAGRRPRVRRVTRVIRHVDPWSVFKVGLIFSLVAYFSCLTAGVLLWRVADATGTIDNVERWFTQFGWETFEFKGGEIFHEAWIIGLFGVVGLTGGLVLFATLFNLVSDIVGGIRVTVLEEEVVERTVSSSLLAAAKRTAESGGGASQWAFEDDQSPSDWSVDD